MNEHVSVLAFNEYCENVHFPIDNKSASPLKQLKFDYFYFIL